MGLLAILVLIAFGFSGAPAEEVKKIRDNSFPLEETYNQEPGVIQHIQAFQYWTDHSWNYTFTEEWPAPQETHQLSVIPVNHMDSDGTDASVAMTEARPMADMGSPEGSEA
jgi:hypothetical protein